LISEKISTIVCSPVQCFSFCQDQHVGASDRFVDDSLVCKPAPIVSESTCIAVAGSSNNIAGFECVIRRHCVDEQK